MVALAPNCGPGQDSRSRAALSCPQPISARRFERNLDLLALFLEFGDLLPLALDDVVRSLFDEFRVGQLLLDLGNLSVQLADFLFKTRLFAPRSMTPASGRQTVASPTMICAEPDGAVSASSTVSARARRRIGRLVGRRRALVSSLHRLITTDLGTCRNVHFCANGADFRNQR